MSTASDEAAFSKADLHHAATSIPAKQAWPSDDPVPAPALPEETSVASTTSAMLPGHAWEGVPSAPDKSSSSIPSKHQVFAQPPVSAFIYFTSVPALHYVVTASAGAAATSAVCFSLCAVVLQTAGYQHLTATE
jgi:hypothetical protein